MPLITYSKQLVGAAQMADSTDSMSSTDYEKVTRLLVERIAERSLVTTTRLEHDLVLPGRASPHQIDVLWEFTTESGHAHRVVFECRRKSRSLEQNDALAFKGVVEEVSFDDVPTTGVLVHVKGFQLGARKIADTYGLIILEMRSPTDKDVKGRLMKIQISMTPRVPVVKDLHMDLSELLSGALSGPVLNYALEVQDPRDGWLRVMDLLQHGEINPTTEVLTPFHRVTRSFDPPVVLALSGKPAAKIRSISATVGEELSDPFDISVGGRENLAWMVKDVLGGEIAWFTHAGQVHLIES
ncbi:hypothetical protein V2S66_19185 [Streptomyces sp. V4-01]|uniref:Restriction endonuclease type IV Mrr domain-containing protein n=1 Tax=Actinacidiphila polyblastidii TaxID=3110430 RepID=A0ABU7PE54_9ACTN|nr:hypothetical protein [Streptomyces sp. V4-01]